MKFKQVNAYTWVLDTGRPSHLGQPPSTEETQYREERHTKKRRYNKTEQMRIYQKILPRCLPRAFVHYTSRVSSVAEN